MCVYFFVYAFYVIMCYALIYVFVWFQAGLLTLASQNSMLTLSQMLWFVETLTFLTSLANCGRATCWCCSFLLGAHYPSGFLRKKQLAPPSSFLGLSLHVLYTACTVASMPHPHSGISASLGIPGKTAFFLSNCKTLCLRARAIAISFHTRAWLCHI